MAGDGKDGDTDANVWYGGQDSFGTRGYRRSRSQHVVHEEDVFYDDDSTKNTDRMKRLYGHTIQMYIVERGRNKDKRQ